MIRAVLFDLDGTLLRIDTARFLEAYIRLLADWFSSRVPRDRFIAALLAATQQMMRKRSATRTLKEVFDDSFYPAVGLSAESTAEPLRAFYAQAYPTLATMASADPAARQAVAAVLERRLTAVLATQPIFPAVAVRQRMAWAGIADLPFALVTSYETSHFCKPQPEYFHEVAGAVGCAPGECLFIGNDAVEDTAARQVGMETYLVTDYLTNPTRITAPPDRMGSLRTLPGLLGEPGPDYFR